MEPLLPRGRERDGEQNARLRENRKRKRERKKEGEKMKETEEASKTKKQNTFSWHCGKADAAGT